MSYSAQVPKAPDANAPLTQLLLAAQIMQPQLCFPAIAMPQALPMPALTAPVVSMPPAGLQDPAQPAACCSSHQEFQARPCSVCGTFSRQDLHILDNASASLCSHKNLRWNVL